MGLLMQNWALGFSIYKQGCRKQGGKGGGVRLQPLLHQTLLKLYPKQALILSFMANKIECSFLNGVLLKASTTRQQ